MSVPITALTGLSSVTAGALITSISCCERVEDKQQLWFCMLGVVMGQFLNETVSGECRKKHAPVA